MASANPPAIVRRQARDFLIEMIRRIPTQFQEWKSGLPDDDEAALLVADDARDFGMGLLKLAAHMGEVIAGQINRVPEKGFLAFLDFLGIDRKPPRAARAPLTFQLAEKAPVDVLVRKGTQIGAAKKDNVIFETEIDLWVTRAVLAGAYSVDLKSDRYIDLSALIAAPGTENLEIFGDSGISGAWLSNRHVVYLGHETLFSRADEAGAEISIAFTLAPDAELPDLDWEFSTPAGWKPAAAGAATGSANAINIKTSGIAPMRVDGRDGQGVLISQTSCWLRATTRNNAPTTVTVLDVTMGTAIRDRPAPQYLAYCNSVQLDVSKDYFPFGERPKFNDTFYIASGQAFAIPGATIAIAVTLSGPPALPVNPLSLAWEYWDGAAWSVIAETTQDGVPVTAPVGEFEYSDTTNAFTQDGSIRFKCPPLAPQSIYGVLDYWIRVRIVEGDYGKEAGYRPSANDALKQALADIEPDSAKYQSIVDLLTKNGLVDTFLYVAATLAAPSIKSLAVAYSFTADAATRPTSRLTEDSFVYSDVSGTAQFQAFRKWDETRPALYLGFDPLTARPGVPLSIYVQVVQPLYGARGSSAAVGEGGPTTVVWWYWNGDNWQRLPVEDETANLTRSGMLRFVSPGDLRDRYLFGKDYSWIRASLESGGYRAPPMLGGFALNTVWASHGTTFKDQVLGSSSDEPNQEFQFAKTPVLEGQVVEVREPNLPSDADRQRITADEGQDAVHAVRDAAGNVTEIWVRWHPVTSLNLSAATDRHYVVDHVTGRIRFGDGLQGRIPPAGKDSIVARTYRAGGGVKGNCETRALTELKTAIALIDKVFNHEASQGGEDEEAIANVSSSGPLRIRSRDRAVTVEDYEWLAREAAGEVAKTRCLALTRGDSLIEANRRGTDPGWITVIVVPQGSEDQPLPTDGLIDNVKQYLANRSLATLGGQIDVIGPRYVPIDVTAEIVPRRIEEAKVVEKRVFDNLRAFLHPLGGGPDGEGWEFGRSVYISEVAAVVQGTEGVDRVRRLAIGTAGVVMPQGRIPIGSNDLPASGRHTVVATGG